MHTGFPPSTFQIDGGPRKEVHHLLFASSARFPGVSPVPARPGIQAGLNQTSPCELSARTLACPSPSSWSRPPLDVNAPQHLTSRWNTKGEKSGSHQSDAAFMRYVAACGTAPIMDRIPCRGGVTQPLSTTSSSSSSSEVQERQGGITSLSVASPFRVDNPRPPSPQPKRPTVTTRQAAAEVEWLVSTTSSSVCRWGGEGGD